MIRLNDDMKDELDDGPNDDSDVEYLGTATASSRRAQASAPSLIAKVRTHATPKLPPVDTLTNLASRIPLNTGDRSTIKLLDRLGPRSSNNDADTPNVSAWRAVLVDGTEISIGDCVEIQVQTAAGRACKPGMVRKILRMDRHCVHVQWLRTSAVGQEGELFLDHGHCQTLPIKCITAKLTTSARLVYDETRNSWSCPAGLTICDACVHQRQRYFRSHVHAGTTYHQLDFIFLDPKSTGQPWAVGQILSVLGKSEGDSAEIHGKVEDGSAESQEQIDHDSVDIQLFERRAHGRNISPTTRDRVALSQIRGKAYVVSDADELTVMDHPLVLFWQNASEVCHRCLASFRAEQADLLALLALERLEAADYYAGGGGSAIAARKYFDVASLVDMDPVACQTLAANFPSAAIVCGQLGNLLDASRSLVETSQLGDTSAQIHLPAQVRLPQPGRIFILTAGPPCQGHSGANMFRSIDDTRNNELHVILNVVKLLQPDFFLLENVPGFKRDWDTSEGGVDGESTRNFAIDAIRKLLAIGYQARLTVLSSRSYGSPQNRIRLFILAARVGIKLPDFPSPTHANPGIRATIFSVEEDADLKKVYLGFGTPGCGPLPAVAAEDAISDLPPFEYAGGTLVRSRAAGIPRFRATVAPVVGATRVRERKVGFTHPVPYATLPRNDYQRRKRGSQTAVVDHQTSHRSQRELDIVFGASAYAGRPGDREVRGCERMTDPHGAFATLMTSSRPGGKYTGPVHWNQRRTFTIAERKRIQGVPDGYTLMGSNDDKDRMLGNMINVDIAEAIYRQIIHQVVLPWWKSAGRPTDVRAQWRHAHPLA